MEESKMKKVDEDVLKILSEYIHNAIDPDFNMGQAIAYGILVNNDLTVQTEQIASNNDIYDMINDNPALVSQVKNYDFITFATCGWAAPINHDNDEDNDLPPSQHPAKRRVRLLVSANSHLQFASSISFSDDLENPVYDYGDARGALAEAIEDLIKQGIED
jgi:hypothetical protein